MELYQTYLSKVKTGVFSLKISSEKGFTLSELLIALAVLGIIATFTIPKVLHAQRDENWNSIAKETAAMMSGVYQSFLLDGGDWQTATPADLSPYMNFITIDTTTLIDHFYGHASPTRPCSDTVATTCFKLHNGAMLRMTGISATAFCTTAERALWFQVDPDGMVADAVPSPTGTGKTIAFQIYSNGRLSTAQDRTNPTCGGGAIANSTPPWFNW